MDIKKDTYLTISNPTVGEFKDRGSKFFAYAFPLNGLHDWEINMNEVKKLHNKARHHCFAFRIGLDKNNFRSSDDGEPSGTAGKPILGQIDKFGLSNVFVVVVRYFGGTKLGVPGLINAYRTSTFEALNKAKIVKKTVEKEYLIKFEYSKMSNVMNAVKELDLHIIEKSFEVEASLTIGIPLTQIDEKMHLLKVKIAHLHFEEDTIELKIDGVDILEKFN